jgi:hypothetical protein
MDSTLGHSFPAGATSVGIYEFDGDSLRICFTDKGGERQKEFSTKGGSHNITLLSRLPEASRVPSGLKHTLETRSGNARSPTSPSLSQATHQQYWFPAAA